jgi:hypothetical protein
VEPATIPVWLARPAKIALANVQPEKKYVARLVSTHKMTQNTAEPAEMPVRQAKYATKEVALFSVEAKRIAMVRVLIHNKTINTVEPVEILVIPQKEKSALAGNASVHILALKPVTV